MLIRMHFITDHHEICKRVTRSVKAGTVIPMHETETGQQFRLATLLCPPYSSNSLGHSHSIYVFDSNPSRTDPWCNNIYDQIVQHISAGYAVVYVGEQDEIATLRRFVRIGFPVEDFIQSGYLTIISKDTFYSPIFKASVLLEQWSKIFSNIEKRIGSSELKGIVGIGMPTDSYFISDSSQQRLVEYESLAADKYEGAIEAMCIYTTDLIFRMPLRHVIRLLNAHQNTAHKGGILKPWNTERGLALVRKSFDASLGNNVSEMVFSILLRDFEMQPEAMIIHPDSFERKLQILLGGTAAEIVLNTLTIELKKDIAY